MAVRKSRNADDTVVSTSVPLLGTAAQLKRIGRLLSLIATKDMPQAETIVFLNSVGYTPSEIAVMLGTTPNTVSVTVYQASRKRGARRTSGKKSPTRG